MDYSISTLLANVRRRGSLPNVSGTGTQDVDLLACLNDVLQLKLAAKIIAVREGYMRQKLDLPLSGTRYRIPDRALGNKLAALLLVDSAGNVLRKLDEIPYARQADYYAGTDCAGYVFEAGSVVLVPTLPSSTVAYVRMVYYIRPNQLQAVTSSTLAVTSVAGNVITVGSHPFSTSTKVDIIKATSPFEHVVIGEAPSATGVGTITVSDASRVEVGDYVCLQGYAPLAQIPGELYPLLAHLTAMELLSSIGDVENYDKLSAALPKLEAEALALISPRNEEGAKKIMSVHGSLGSLGGSYGRTRGF